LVATFAAPAGAQTRFVEPGGNPYHVALDTNGKPLPFTVTVAGFLPGHLVYLEQCNGRHPADPNWSPSLDCDAGGAPPAAIVDKSGKATFPATDYSLKFTPIMGQSPSSLFNCVRPNTATPQNGLQSYPVCQVRVSSNNASAVADQVFLPIVFGGSGGSGSSTSTWLIVGVIAVVVVVAIGAFALFRKRSART
jgi:hypothetical protein